MSIRRLWLLGAGACAFVVFLVAQLPAAIATRWLGPENLRMGGVTGTLWSGSAASLTAGSLRLAEIQWSLAPIALLLGELSADIDTRLGQGTASGTLSRSISGTISCTGCRFSGPVADLWPLFPALKAVSGRLEIELATLEVRNAWPTRVIGTARLSSDLGALGGGDTDAAPANFEVLLNSDPVAEDGNIEAVVQDSGGPLQLSARLGLTPPGNFRFDGKAAARPGAPAALVNALVALGPRGADGSTQLTLTGSF